MTDGFFIDNPRLLRGMVITGAMIVAALAVWAFLLLTGIAGNTDASRRTDELSSCRAVFRADVDDANARLSEAFGVIQLIVADATVSRQDSFVMAEAAAAMVPAAVEQIAARGAVAEANAAYREANELSRSDPEKFLAECEAA